MTTTRHTSDASPEQDAAGPAAAPGRRATGATGAFARAADDAARVPVGPTAGPAYALAAAAAVLWSLAVRGTDPDGMNDLGLVSVLPPLFWVAAAAAVAATVLALRPARPSHGPVLAAVGSIVLLVYLTPAAISGSPRLEAAYRHLGIVEQVRSTGALDRTIDAYFSWPGFFAGLAWLQDASGLGSWFPLATVAPALVALAYLPPLALVLRGVGADRRTTWVAVVLFLLANWSGQDYFAPQAFGVWLYLCALGLLLTAAPSVARSPLSRWRRRVEDREHRHRAAADPDPSRWVLLFVVAVLTVTIQVSHQLTPVIWTATLLLLWAVGRVPYAWLPAGAVLLQAFWLLLPAWPYVGGHLDVLVGGLGDASGAASANVGARVAAGTFEHQVVVLARLAQTAVLWLAAAAGAWWWRRRHGGGGGWALLALAAGPFLMLPLQAYGGEMLIRSFLFSLPVVALMVALLVRGWPSRGALPAVGLGVVLALLLSMTMLTRYGNEPGESFRPDEIAAYAWVYDRDEPDAGILALTATTPWRWREYAELEHRSLADGAPGTVVEGRPSLAQVVSVLQESDASPQYVVLTRSQVAMAELSGATPPGVLPDLVDRLTRDSRFTVVRQTENAVVMRWEPSDRTPLP